MKIREGVMNSQWSGECGESSYEMTQPEFEEMSAKAKAEADVNKKKSKLEHGDIIEVEYSGTDPEALEITEVVEDLVVGSSEYNDWCCERCRVVTKQGTVIATRNGCAACNDGFSHGEDRFVRRLGPDNLP
jgi:hypothetical protein